MLPVPARIGIQLVLAAIIYFGFGETEFPLPMGDTLPISGLMGGYLSPSFTGMETGMHNTLSMGVIGFVLGLISSIIGGIVGKLTGGKGE